MTGITEYQSFVQKVDVYIQIISIVNCDQCFVEYGHPNRLTEPFSLTPLQRLCSSTAWLKVNSFAPLARNESHVIAHVRSSSSRFSSAGDSVKRQIGNRKQHSSTQRTRDESFSRWFTMEKDFHCSFRLIYSTFLWRIIVIWSIFSTSAQRAILWYPTWPEIICCERFSSGQSTAVARNHIVLSNLQVLLRQASTQLLASI